MNFLSSPLLRGWCLAAAVALAPWTVHAQTVPDWTAATPGNLGAMVALDRASNSFVAGTATAGGITLTKLGPTGAVAWQRSYFNTGNLGRAVGLDVDAAGNALLSGMLLDATGYSQAAVVLKVDPAGNLLWQDLSPSLHAMAWRTVSDAAGNVYSLVRQTVPGVGGTVVQDMVLSKISTAGVRQWTRSYGAVYPAAESLVLLPSGLVVVSGAGRAAGQSVLAAYDAAGNAVWTRLVASDDALNLATGPQGELVAVGSAGLGYLVEKYDAALNLLWRNLYPARGAALRAAVDAAGNVLVTGAVDANTGLAQVVLYDWLTMKLSPTGTQLWTRSYGQLGAANETPLALALGSDGAVYLTGQGAFPGNNTSFAPVGTATVKLAADGTQAWAATTLSGSRGLGLKLSGDGGVLVLADSPQTLLRYPQSGAPNRAPTALASASPSAGPAPLAVQFSAAGSADADGLIAGYAWDFGDGQTSALANPTHTYAAGSYTARLTVTDNLGAASAAAAVVISANTVVLPPARPSALTLAAARVVEGTATTATVKLSSAAGATLQLTSSNPAVAGVPATVVVPKGATSVSFTITAAAVRRNTGVTIRASANGASASALLTVLNR